VLFAGKVGGKLQLADNLWWVLVARVIARLC
jgi:hypothetical protein